MDFVQDDFKEEDTIHQMMGDMDIGNPKKPTTTMFLVDLNVLQSIRILGVFLRLYTYRKFWNVIATTSINLWFWQILIGQYIGKIIPTCWCNPCCFSLLQPFII